jgi:hypothetical protein
LADSSAAERLSIPSGTELVSISGAGSVSHREIIWSLGALAPGTKGSVPYLAPVPTFTPTPTSTSTSPSTPTSTSTSTNTPTSTPTGTPTPTVTWTTPAPTPLPAGRLLAPADTPAPTATVDPCLPHVIINPGARIGWTYAGRSFSFQTGPVINGPNLFMPVIHR